MQRITITIDDELLTVVDAVMQRHGYTNRSEAVREMIRHAAAHETTAADATDCVGVLAYVFDHHTRALAQRLTDSFHDDHDLTVAGMHVHLNHQSCLEVSVLKGTVSAVRGLADDLTAQRGVRHTNLHVVPVTVSDAGHAHGAGTHTHRHIQA
jgi:CopG family nickel-responsive transcriptional regulator